VDLPAFLPRTKLDLRIGVLQPFGHGLRVLLVRLPHRLLRRVAPPPQVFAYRADRQPEAELLVDQVPDGRPSPQLDIENSLPALMVEIKEVFDRNCRNFNATKAHREKAMEMATAYGWSVFLGALDYWRVPGGGCVMKGSGPEGEARIVLTGVGGKPVRALEAEMLLVGGADPFGQAAADAARTAIDPDADIHASKEYRARLAGVLTERAIRLAYERARESPPAALDIRRMLETMSRHA